MSRWKGRPTKEMQKEAERNKQIAQLYFVATNNAYTLDIRYEAARILRDIRIKAELENYEEIADGLKVIFNNYWRRRKRKNVHLKVVR